jgi:hypothetical protein
MGFTLLPTKVEQPSLSVTSRNCTIDGIDMSTFPLMSGGTVIDPDAPVAFICLNRVVNWLLLIPARFLPQAKQL